MPEQVDLQAVYDRYRRATEEVDAAWSGRRSDPGRLKRALEELNEAAAELTRLA